MISDRSIKRVARHGDDYDRATRLKASLAQIRRTRRPFHLERSELEPILEWKLGAQRGRTERLRAANPDATIREVTRAAFGIALGDRVLELRLRTAVLCALSGIGVPVASAILALTHPERYGIVDFRVWRQVFGREKRSFGVANYIAYMERIWPIAERLGWDVQEVDWAIWHHDKLRADGDD